MLTVNMQMLPWQQNMKRWRMFPKWRLKSEMRVGILPWSELQSDPTLKPEPVRTFIFEARPKPECHIYWVTHDVRSFVILVALQSKNDQIIQNDHFYWRLNQLDCFNNNWRQKCPSLRRDFACRSDTFWQTYARTRTDPTYNSGHDISSPMRNSFEPKRTTHFLKFVNLGAFVAYARCQACCCKRKVVQEGSGKARTGSMRSFTILMFDLTKFWRASIGKLSEFFSAVWLRMHSSSVCFRVAVLYLNK